MPFAAGVFSRIYSWATEQASSPIEIAKLDTQEEDFKTAFNNCMLRDGTGLPTAAQDFNGQKITNLGTAAAGGDALSRTAGDARYGQVISAVKSATTSRSASSTLADDPHLTLALTTGTWAVEAWFPAWATTSNAGGFQWAFAFSGTSSSASFSSQGLMGTAFATVSKALLSAIGFATLTVGTGVTQVDWVRASGMIVVTGAGNLTLQWAQVLSNANAANVGIGSWIRARKLA